MDQTLDPGQGRSAQETLKPGRILNGKYTIEKLIGQDGTGARYQGWEISRGIRVVITEYSSVDWEEACAFSDNGAGDAEKNGFILRQREELFRKVRILKQFSYSSHLAQIQDSFVENHRAYVVEEYLEGVSLEEYVVQQGGSLPADNVFRMMEPIVDLLRKIHKQGLLHQNISGANLVRMPDDTLKLVNFDLMGSGKTARGGVPPQQRMVQGGFGTWTDVYGLCRTIFYCLTGGYPAEPLDGKANSRPNIPKNVKLKPAERKKALEKGLAVKRQDRVLDMDALYQMLYGKKTFWKSWKLLVPVALCAAVFAAALQPDKGEKWEVEEYERGSSNGNILNGGRCYADGQTGYFIDSRDILCRQKTGQDEAVKVLPEKVKYLNVLQDQIFLYEYEAGGIYSLSGEGGRAVKVADAPVLDEETGDGIYGLSAVKDTYGDRLYYVEVCSGIRRIISCGLDGRDRKVLLEDDSPDMETLSVYKGYIYYQDSSGVVSRMRTDGTNQEALPVKDRILTFLADNDELYMLSVDGSSILVTDLEGNKMEEVEGVSPSTLNTGEDWIYFQDLEGFLCKSRKDGENRIQLWQHKADSISIWKDGLYVTSREKDYKNCYHVFYDMEQETYSFQRVNPFHYDYMRGNAAANMLDGPGQMAVRTEEEGGVYYVYDNTIALQDGDDYKVVLSGRDNPQYLNAADGALYFVDDGSKICRMDAAGNHVDILETKQGISCLSLVNDTLFYESSGFIYSFDLEAETETVLAEESNVVNMNVLDGYIFWRNSPENVVKRMDWEGQETRIYEGDDIKALCAAEGKVYVCDGNRILGMDYDGTVFFEHQEQGGFSLVNAEEEWVYLMMKTSLKRVNTRNGEEEVLAEYVSYKDDFYLLDGKLFIVKRDDGHVEKIYCINPDDGLVSEEESSVFWENNWYSFKYFS